MVARWASEKPFCIRLPCATTLGPNGIEASEEITGLASVGTATAPTPNTMLARFDHNSTGNSPKRAISPPAAHMRYTGTISIPESAFEAMLEGAARSFKQHGFRNVFFLGDHGGYQKNEERVAARLNREWARDPACRVHALLEYYEVTQRGYVAALKQRGYSQAEIGTHAGLADTSLALAVDPSLVRGVMLKDPAKSAGIPGVQGDPRRATAQLGQLGVQQIIDASVAAIQRLTREQK